MSKERGPYHEGMLCWEPNRLSRNPIDNGTLIALVAAGHTIIQTPNRRYDESPDALFMLTLELGMAHTDNAKRSRDVKRGIESALLRGQWPTKAPLGYVNVHTPDGRHRVEPDSDRFPVLQEAFRKFLRDGYTIPEILTIVNDERGFLTPRCRKTGGRPLSVSGIYHAFHNPFYAGLMFVHGKIYQGSHMPMITVEDFETIQDRLGTQVARRTTKILRETYLGRAASHTRAADSGNLDEAARAPSPPVSGRGVNRDFSLTGLMTCGSCGCAITASRITNRHGSVYVYYHCTHRIRGCDCREPHIRAEDLEHQFLDFLDRLTLPEPIAEAFLSELARREGTARGEVEEKIAEIDRAVAATKANLSKLLDHSLAGLVDEEDYREKRNELVLRQERLEGERRVLASLAEDRFKPLKEAISLLTLAKERFQGGDGATKRSIIKIIGSNPTLQDRKLRIIAKKPFSFLEESGRIPIRSG
ncbi:MAG: recombinase zinc beta ribbon domain-containing protein [Candidatus Kerfeldbacteria bacterium]|nr:recombinase zinc beta ribbon domain-containing protein [Candidatus Kerfeldbacteria bacterium]